MAKSSSDKVVRRGVYLYLDGKEVENNIGAVEKEMRKLISAQKKMTLGSDEYIQTTAKIKSLKSIITEHNEQLKQVSKTQHLSLSKGVDMFNKYAASITAVLAALTGVILKLNSFRKLTMEREESKANVQALTGLDDSSIAWLEQKAVELSTSMDKSGLRIRKSASEILKAYMMVGSNKPELLEVKEDLNAVTVEAMRLAEASGMDLPQAVDATTTALNQYGAKANEAAKYVNVLAAGSKYGAANVEQQTAAILKAGTIAAASNVSIEELVGTIEMLGEKGIKNEIAGTGLKTFFTRLATGATDTNPKVVGLTTALDNLNKKVAEAEAKTTGGGTALLKKLFGDEAMQVSMILSQNTEKVKEYTQAVTDTNIAMEQAAINSDTAAAKMAQVKNELNETGIQLMKELNPAIIILLSRLTNLSRYGIDAVKFINEHKIVLGMLTAAVTVYMLRLKALIVLEKSWQALRSFGTKTMLASKGVINLIASAYYLLTGRITLATRAFKIFKLTLLSNPFTAILTAITTITTAILLFAQRTNAAKEAYKNFVKEAASAESELKRMYNSILSTNDGTRARIDLINEFNSKYGSYLSNLLSEKATIDEITTAYNQAALAIKSKIAQETLSKETNEIQKRAIEEQSQSLTKISDILRTKFTGSDVARRMQVITSATEKYIAAGRSVDDIAYGVGNALLKTKKFTLAEIADIQIAMKKYAKNVKNTATEIQSVQDKLSPWLPQPKKKPGNELPEVVVTPNPNPNNSKIEENDKEKKERIKKETLRIEKEFYEKQAKLKEQYLRDISMTEEDFNNLSTDLTYQELNEKLKILGLEPEKRAEIQNKMMELKFQFEKKFREAEKAEIKNARQERYDELESAYKNELKWAEKYHKKHHTSETEYTLEQRKILLRFLDEVKNDITLSEEQKVKIRKSANDKILNETSSFSDEEIEKHRTLIDSIIEISKDSGEAIAQFFTEEETDIKKFLANILSTVLTHIEKRLVAEQAAAIASVTIRDIAEKGFLGIAAAAGKIALITAAFETAKGVLGNFYTGGYTGPGDWDEPKGYVHSNEFVANRFAVANPHVRPVLDLIDAAQRSNSIANLTGEDIASVARSSSSERYNHVVTKTQPSSNPDNAVLADTLLQLRRVMILLHGRLNDPFYTINTVSGRKGVKAKLDEYDKMINNKSRLKK